MRQVTKETGWSAVQYAFNTYIVSPSGEEIPLNWRYNKEVK